MSSPDEHIAAVKSQPDKGYAALLVSAGIFLSRIAGLIRDRVFAHFFGNSAAADAFRAAFRIPNFLQNLFGEGTLSASFIPVYARLLAHGNTTDAQKVASGIAALLFLTVSVLVALGIACAPYLIAVIAPGFTGEKKELTIRMVRILFPGAGLLVCSPWCLCILKSDRKFFLSYGAPVLWNIVIIVALILFGHKKDQFPLAQTVAWASVVGSGVQFGVQVPSALLLVRRLHIGLFWAMSATRSVIANFVPVFIGRGVFQISAYVDTLIASLLPTGAVAALTYAQTLCMLPVSLFGMAVSASELPALSSAVGGRPEIAQYIVARLDKGLRRIAFFVVPSVAAFLLLGDVIVAAIYQTGCFGRNDVVYVWAVLAGATIGLLATTLGRLYSSAFYAVGDTRTPLRFAVLRVLLAGTLGYTLAIVLPPLLAISSHWGLVGLTLASGSAGWIEYLLLRWSLHRRIGRTRIGIRFMSQLWLAAGTGAVVGLLLKIIVHHWHPILAASLILASYSMTYLALLALLMGTRAVRLLAVKGA